MNKLKMSKKVLFVHQFLAMGDAVFLSPVYKAVKDNIEGINIAVLTNSYSMPFVQAIPHVDHVYPLETFLRSDISRLKRFIGLCKFFIKHRFDTIVLRHDKRFSQRGLYWASKLCLLKIISMGPHLEKEIIENRHVVEGYLSILEKEGFKISDREHLYINLPSSAFSRAKDILKGKKRKLAGIIPMSKVKVKNLTAAKTAEIIKNLSDMSYDVILFCADKDFSKDVLALTGETRLTHVEHVDFSLLLGIIAHCNLFIGVDTGPLHIAAAFGVPAVGLYGPTSGIVTGPYGRSGIIVQSRMKCRYYNPVSPFSPKVALQECYTENRCKLSSSGCMGKIELNEVLEAIHKASDLGL